MGGVLPDHILVHTATPVKITEDPGSGQWIEGEKGPVGPAAVAGAPFPCVLFMPSPGGAADTPYRPRVVRTPTLLYNPTREDDTPVLVSNEDELLIDAPELAPWTGAPVQRWLADGDAQPFGPPGQVYGLMATLRIVKD